MGRHTIFVNVALTCVWVILMESLSWQNIAIGLFMSMLSMHFIGKFFDFEEIKSIKFTKLAFYPIWLVGRIYMDALFLIRLVFSTPKWGIITHELDLKNDVLTVILCDSITLTPGSVYLQRNKNKITILCLGDSRDVGYPASVEGMQRIERMLIGSDNEKNYDDD